MHVVYINGGNEDHHGLIPMFLNPHNPKMAWEQIDQNYQHGGGWRSFKGFTYNPELHTITYPGDPPYQPRVKITFRDETIYIYDHAWVNIVQKDGTNEIARID